jgi:uncharacterized protein (TIGR02453 family)
MSTVFTPAALKFLRSLARNNDREWFTPRKAVFETELKAPMLALIEEINHDLLEFAPDYVRPAQKAMMRIYRDTRFSNNKLPYKIQVAAWWSRHGLEKTSGGGFYLSLSATEVTIAAGCYMPHPEQLLAIRRHLSAAGGNQHGELRRLLASKKLLAVMQPFDPDEEGRPKLTRAPKGFSPGDAALDLLLYRQWGVSATLPSGEALKPTLRKEIVQRFKLATPLVDLLNAPLLASREEARPRPIF